MDENVPFIHHEDGLAFLLNVARLRFLVHPGFADQRGHSHCVFETVADGLLAETKATFQATFIGQIEELSEIYSTQSLDKEAYDYSEHGKLFSGHFSPTLLECLLLLGKHRYV